MRRITSALFLDFDNIFSGLLALDRAAAFVLAEDPGTLVDGLGGHGLGDAAHRDLLVRRVYLNPNGTVPDAAPANGDGRLRFDRFRPHLVRAGFEVIDCPALTLQHKNAADIRIVMDVLAALDAPVRYDEIIVASSDADFTPLLLKLRAQDRRTTILTANDPVPAYQAVADRHIGGQSLLSLLTPATDGPGKLSTGAKAQSTCQPRNIEDSQKEAEARTSAALARLVTDASGPLPLSSTGTALRKAAGGEIIQTTKWFGHKQLGRFIKARRSDLRVNASHVWDPSRHKAPAA